MYVGFFLVVEPLREGGGGDINPPEPLRIPTKIKKNICTSKA